MKNQIFKIKLIAPLLWLCVLGVLSCTDTKKVTQLNELKGKWVNTDNDFLEINDTSSNLNFLDESGFGTFYLEYFGDTLSFQSRGYSSATNYTILNIDSFNMKVIAVSDSFLSVVPLSLYIKNYYNNKDTIRFIRQEYFVDEGLIFKKIIFHTTICYGDCPVYHLELLSSGHARLHKERVHVKGEGRHQPIDSTIIGYYSGIIKDTSLQKLVHTIKTINLQNREFGGELNEDLSTITLIIYYNDQRKLIQITWFNRVLDNLMNQLYRICDKEKLEKIDNIFELEMY